MRATEVREKSALSKQLRLDVAQLTDVGRKRPHNEDNMAYVIPKDGQVMAKKGALFIVADGMGGHAAGEVASEIAVDTVSSIYYQDENDDLALSLMNAIKRANALIHQRAAENMLRSGMGTTCVAAVLRGDMAYVANVGDSRAYLVRKGQAKQVSQDHSWVEEQVRAGLLTKDQARSHAQRNVITRSLGTQAEVEVDVFSEELEEGDTIILCSDGLSGSIGEDDLRAIVNQYVPQESVYHLVERANENGGPDNITAIVVRVQEVGEESPRTLHPVQVGGRITDESTVVLGRIPSSSLSAPVRVEDPRIPSGPLSTPSGPLFSPGASTQATVTVPHRRRRPLLFPLVILLVLLMVLVVGAGGYLFFLRPANTQAKLTQASDLIVQAQGATDNPNAALQNLAKAQDELRTVKSSSLNQQQSNELSDLQKRLVSGFRDALANYNKAALITPLPCTGGSPTAIDSTASRTTPSTLVVVKDEKNTAFSYVHMADSTLYQVDTQRKTLLNKYPVPVVLLTNDTQHIFVLTIPNGQGPPTYELHVLRPQQNGALSEPGNAPKVTVPSELITQGFKPQLMTTWEGDIYIILTAAQSTQSNANQAMILDYKADKLQDAPQKAKISISTGLIGVAAFPNKQLFLLHTDGTVKSLQVGSASPSEIDVQSTQSIATPWPVDAQQFTPATPIVAPPAPAKNKLLSVPVPIVTTPPQSFLTAGQVDNAAHLYITDNANHRVLDFTMATVGSTNQAAPTTTSASSTPAPPAAGGGMVSPGGGTGEVDMQLMQQYTSPSVLPAVRSSVIDPEGKQLDLMTMDGNTYASVVVGVSRKNVCSSQ
jgi:serine/threonine protein phosphatase PrpC